jgi:hypothetical protein
VIFGLFALLGMTGQAWTAESGKTEWERTVEAARKEGQVNVYIGGWGAVLESGVFEQSYPGIKVVAVAGRGGETAKRILAERRAGKFIADVSSEGVGSNYRTLHAANSFDPIKPVLLLPEVTDESRWWQGKHRYVDPEGKFVFRYVGVPQTGNISYNSTLVNPKEIKSIWDFFSRNGRERSSRGISETRDRAMLRCAFSITIPPSAVDSSNVFSVKWTLPFSATSAKVSTGSPAANSAFAFSARTSIKRSSRDFPWTNSRSCSKKGRRYTLNTAPWDC